MNHKRGRQKNARAGSTYSKPQKMNGQKESYEPSMKHSDRVRATRDREYFNGHPVRSEEDRRNIDCPYPPEDKE